MRARADKSLEACDILPAVITRKVGGCNKTLKGALVHSVLASLMVTCKQQGQKFLDLARQLWSTDQPQAIPLVLFKQPRNARRWSINHEGPSPLTIRLA